MINYEKKSDGLYFNISGEIDESSSASVKTYMDDIIEKFPTKNVYVNMSKITFMDSSGVGILLGRYKKLLDSSRRLFIVDPTKRVDDILELSGIYKIIPKK